MEQSRPLWHSCVSHRSVALEKAIWRPIARPTLKAGIECCIAGADYIHNVGGWLCSSWGPFSGRGGAEGHAIHGSASQHCHFQHHAARLLQDLHPPHTGDHPTLHSPLLHLYRPIHELLHATSLHCGWCFGCRMRPDFYCAVIDV